MAKVVNLFNDMVTVMAKPIAERFEVDIQEVYNIWQEEGIPMAKKTTSRTRAASKVQAVEDPGDGCKHKYSRLDNKGKYCGQPRKDDHDYCEVHLKQQAKKQATEASSSTKSKGKSPPKSETKSLEISPYKPMSGFFVADKLNFILRAADPSQGETSHVVVGKLDDDMKLRPLTIKEIGEVRTLNIAYDKRPRSPTTGTLMEMKSPPKVAGKTSLAASKLKSKAPPPPSSDEEDSS